MITYYKCEICGATSTNKEAVIKCENKGAPIPLVKEGDIIYFKDCEETPVLHNSLPNGSYLRYKLTDIITKMEWFIGKLYKYRVLKIEIIGHDIKYILGPIPDDDENFANFTYIDLNTTYKSYTYPTIEGNELMQKVLDLYNKGE